MTLDEPLGRPYTCLLRLVTEDTDLAIDELVGANALLEIMRGEHARVLKGCVDEIEYLGTASGRAQVEIRIVPALAWLERSSGSRIFQGKTIPEIIEAIVAPVLGGRERALDVSALAGRAFQPRDYCVQFEETDLDFLHRLLEEEGLTYRFDHTDARWETLVMLPGTGGFPTFTGLDGSSELSLVHDGDAAASVESIASLGWARRVRAPRVHQRDWDWTSTPPKIHEATHDNPQRDPSLDPVPEGEVYQSGDHRLLDLELSARGERKQQALAVRDASGRGRSNVTGLAPGLVFELVHDELEGRYLVTHVVHEADAPQADMTGDASGGPSYENRFTCIPASTPHRLPRITARPVIPGPQTAVVVGPAGEEIHTDEHGRIKVRMHWDRSDTAPEEASCWLRVAQMWGGPSWGTVFIPRIGMEVIVTFINGDPDRPICTGSVYNGGNRPPYPLPDEKTKSTIKTSSSPGGNGFNELTFEDAAGAEQIIIHAQKDFNETVLNDHTTSVGHDQSISVTNDQSTSVEGNQSNTVTKDQTETVTGNVTVTVEGQRTRTIQGAETLTVNNTRSATITGADSLTVGGARSETFQATRTTTVVKDDSETITTGNKSVTVASGALSVYASTSLALAQGEGGVHQLVLQNNALLSTTGDFAVTNGKVSVYSKGGVLVLEAAEEIGLVCGAASIKLTSDGTIDIMGAAKASMGTPGSTVVAEPGGVTVNGPHITSQASGIHEVIGALVKIN